MREIYNRKTTIRRTITIRGIWTLMACQSQCGTDRGLNMWDAWKVLEMKDCPTQKGHLVILTVDMLGDTLCQEIQCTFKFSTFLSAGVWKHLFLVTSHAAASCITHTSHAHVKQVVRRAVQWLTTSASKLQHLEKISPALNGPIAKTPPLPLRHSHYDTFQPGSFIPM